VFPLGGSLPKPDFPWHGTMRAFSLRRQHSLAHFLSNSPVNTARHPFPAACFSPRPFFLRLSFEKEETRRRLLKRKSRIFRAPGTFDTPQVISIELFTPFFSMNVLPSSLDEVLILHRTRFLQLVSPRNWVCFRQRQIRLPTFGDDGEFSTLFLYWTDYFLFSPRSFPPPYLFFPSPVYLLPPCLNLETVLDSRHRQTGLFFFPRQFSSMISIPPVKRPAWSPPFASSCWVLP